MTGEVVLVKDIATLKFVIHRRNCVFEILLVAQYCSVVVGKYILTVSGFPLLSFIFVPVGIIHQFIQSCLRKYTQCV